VNPAELQRHLRITDGHTRLDATVLTLSPADCIMFRAPRPSSNELRVTLDRKLVGHEGELALDSEITESLVIAPLFTLLRAEADQPGARPRTSVTLQFSANLDAKQVLPDIRVSPAIRELTVHCYGSTLELQGPFECGKRYTASVAADLLDDSGR